ncbi:MAG: metallophosphoesterase family protein [archaeon]
MKYLVIADIHSNLEALEKVFEETVRMKFDKILCLGGIVGHGASPNECIELLKEKKALCIMGNHDAACVGLMNLSWFRPESRKSIEWTKKILTGNNLGFLKDLPKFFSTKFLLTVHGTPENPLKEHMDERKAEKTLEQVAEDLILVGHNHNPFYYTEKEKMVDIKGSHTIKFEGKRMVVSMPSVGQPRDVDNRTGYGILDFEKKELEIKRIHYDWKTAAEKIRKAGLPEFSATRLEKGI